ncbi:hypothetical protein EII29_07075 [Leptotrichia sp. OH3620_COT-345]|uniref:hypothetical protein n=1 Tax=Leptotrichia sp. OH3620_COT-345 TaxID=2491048 RepID=UPI000F64727D|nr:hypothetical protein [Leptotrichia sp. OH3620_COT-345]RRD39348.1 hypothetical protein EII29_07075 [Leptotrichia sp. OH3620_COT-345]
MVWNIGIYMRSNFKIYIYINEEVFYYENQELDFVLETLREEYEQEENKINLYYVLHFSYFVFNTDELVGKSKVSENLDKNDGKTGQNQKNMKTNLYDKDFISNFLTKNVNSINKKLYLNYFENTYINMYLLKKKISELKKISGKYGFKVSEIKADFISIYNFYKEENLEILHIGEEESLRFVIENSKITEIEKLDLKNEDVSDINNFDFGNMKVIITDKEDIKAVFEGAELYEEPDFKSEKRILSMENIRSIKSKDIFIILFLILGYFSLNRIIPLEREIEKNEKIKSETKKLEKEYLYEKNDKMPDYTEELVRLNEIDNSIRRKEYFSMIKFLIDNSEYGVSYTKINYEKGKWLIQGEVDDFNSFEKFEKNILKKYMKSELGYIKDSENAIVFEYTILE